MKACVLQAPAKVETNPLEYGDVPDPLPGRGEVLVRVHACAVCRTDLHVIEGELPPRKSPVIPGHQVVGTVERLGKNAGRFAIGTRVGIAWLHKTDGTCQYCRAGAENLCDNPEFTGYSVDGGYAESIVAPESF
ncbi:MAG TPA: alcohol dehydrogenase catalytic domain-containing protein, partial [Candidatus Acidoferrum sp.]